MSAAPTDKSIPYIPLASGADDGWSNEDEATAACFCGAVQLKFPTYGPGYAGAFLCHCVDCRKITASMFASNFVVLDTHLTHLRGRYNLTAFAQSRDRVEEHYDGSELLFFDVWHADVSRQLGVPGEEHSSSWHHR
ncbi:hypothetical protein C8R45DRAFT_1124206 [Mycena sanguinolenta]|nr:hypothetical protein C8R45DRAFT_1124206 [Mycena sanguinolenta]